LFIGRNYSSFCNFITAKSIVSVSLHLPLFKSSIFVIIVMPSNIKSFIVLSYLLFCQLCQGYVYLFFLISIFTLFHCWFGPQNTYWSVNFKYSGLSYTTYQKIFVFLNLIWFRVFIFHCNSLKIFSCSIEIPLISELMSSFW